MKDKTVAAILAFFFGGLGVHKFYMGKMGSGLLMLLFCWTGIPSIVAFVQAILYLCATDQEFNRKYCGIYIEDNQNQTSNATSNSNNNNNNIL